MSEVLEDVTLQRGLYRKMRKLSRIYTRGDPKVTGTDLLRMRAF
jgi:hypothetical protein